MKTILLSAACLFETLIQPRAFNFLPELELERHLGIQTILRVIICTEALL